MKPKKLIILSVIFLFATLVGKAQFPNATMFNTAVDATGTGTLALSSQDLHWTAALTNSLGVYSPCVVVFTQGWSNSPAYNASWISYPHTCSVNPADHSCDGLDLSIYYKLVVNLPVCASYTASNAYCVTLNLMGDNCVQEVFLNGVSNYQSTVPTPSTYAGYYTPNQVAVTLCSGWQPGANTIIVRVISGAYSYGGQEGFLATATQTINTTSVQTVSVISSQTNISCFGLTNGSASVTASGGSSPYTYTWFPSGGNSNSTGGLAPGTYTVAVKDASNCISSQTLSIVQPAATTLNISASSATACVGTSITLTALNSGGTPAYTYSWLAGPTTASYNVTQAIAGNYTFTATSHDANNCLSSKTISVQYVNSPTLNITGNFTICPGETTTLTASGANSYSWGATSGSILIVSPTVTTSYTVTGSASGCTNTKTVSVIKSKCTGISEINEAKGPEIYPNPTSGLIRFTNTPELAVIEIYNSTGIIIYKTNSATERFELDFSEKPSGIYFVKTLSNNNLSVKKIIKE